MIKNKEAILLIAGIFTHAVTKMVERYLTIFSGIVISTYKDEINDELNHFKNIYLKYENVVLIENSMPFANNYHNSQNVYYQCFSVIEGLLQINTPYVIKMRSDELYSSFDELLQICPKNKILTCNIFCRDVSIFWGSIL
jgi:hypothetical protein